MQEEQTQRYLMRHSSLSAVELAFCLQSLYDLLMPCLGVSVVIRTHGSGTRAETGSVVLASMLDSDQTSPDALLRFCFVLGGPIVAWGPWWLLALHLRPGLSSAVLPPWRLYLQCARCCLPGLVLLHL